MGSKKFRPHNIKADDLVSEHFYQVTVNKWYEGNSGLITGLYPWTLSRSIVCLSWSEEDTSLCGGGSRPFNFLCDASAFAEEEDRFEMESA